MLPLAAAATAMAGAPQPRPAPPAGRIAESILPLLAYGPSCISTIALRNLAETPVDVELEGHRASGGLAPLAGRAGRLIHLAPGERGSYQLEIPEAENPAWVRVREHVPPLGTPAVSVTGSAECRQGNQLRTVARDVAYPTRNPWFASDVAGLRGSVVSVLNVSANAARVSVCYSAGNLFSVPGETAASRELQPVCSAAYEVQIPPFGSRYFPVDSQDNSYCSVRTLGDAVVLQLLRPAREGVRTYTVDSTIKFGGEVPPAPPESRR